MINKNILIKSTLLINTILFISIILSANSYGSEIYRRKDILRSTADNLGNFLKENAGIKLIINSDRGYDAVIHMNGNKPENIKIYFNDQIINYGFDNTANLYDISLEFIECIQIFMPDPVLNGLNSSGGIIKIYTREYVEKTPFSKIEGSWGNYNTRKYNFIYINKIKKFDYLFGVSQKSGLGEHLKNDFEALNLLFNFKYTFDSSLNIKIDNNYDDDGAGNYLNINDTTLLVYRRSKENKYNRFEINKNTNNIGNFKIAYSNNEIIFNFDTFFTKDNSKTEIIDFLYKKDFSDYLLLNLGYSNRKNSFSGIRESNEIRDKIEVQSYFIKTNINFTQDLQLSLGNRSTILKDYEDINMPGIDLNYQIFSGLNINPFYNKGYALPSYYDIYGDNRMHKPANSTLKIEESDTYGIKLDYNNSSVNINTKIYESKNKDFLSFEKVNNTDNYILTKNYNKVTSKNIDMSVKADFFNNFTGVIGHSFSDVVNNENDNKIPYNPVNKTTYYLVFNKKYFKGDLNLNIRFGGESVSSSYVDVSNTDELSSYALLNGKIIVRIIDFYFYWGIDNIQRAEYYTYKNYTMPKRRVTFGFYWEFMD